MRTALKWSGIAVGSVVALLACFLVYVQITGIPRYPHTTPVRKVTPTPELVAKGRDISISLCQECHLNPDSGRLTGKRLAEIPAAFGTVFSRNITGSKDHGIGRWTDGELAYLLRTGLKPDGTYLPPYMVKLPLTSDEEIDAVIAFLRSDDPLVAPTEVDPPGRTTPSLLVKALTHTVMKPLPFPTAPIVEPPRTDQVAYGRYLVGSRDCYGCHSADFKTLDPLTPEKSPGYLGGGNLLKTPRGEDILSANLTPDAETGIGRWSEGDFSRAVRRGIRPDGRFLHAPMSPKPELDEEQVAAIYAYLRTVPPIRNAVARLKDPIPEANAGKRAYEKYGCMTCHGDAGFGVGDLRTANQHYPKDADLLEWILDAPRLKPGTKMLAFRGVVDAADYEPLVRHVRKLSVNGRDETASR